MKACDTEKANDDEKAIDHMYTLSNSQLTLHILDPVDDEDRLGTRYVSGCYVYQVTDAVHGDLLAGPDFAQEHPPVYHGQGMPEAFRNALGEEEGVRLILGNSLVSAEPDPEQNEHVPCSRALPVVRRADPVTSTNGNTAVTG